MATLIDVPIETYDERLSTVTAQRALTEAGVRGRAGRQVIDKVAAAVILQAFLDHRRCRRSTHEAVPAMNRARRTQRHRRRRRPRRARHVRLARRPLGRVARGRRGRARPHADAHRQVDRLRRAAAGQPADHRGGVLRLVVHPPGQRARVRSGAPIEFNDRRGRDAQTRSASGSRTRASSRTPRSSATTPATTVGIEIVPGPVPHPDRRHVGNMLGRAPHAAQRDVRQRHVPRRASRCSQMAEPARRRAPELRRRGVPRRGQRSGHPVACSGRPARTLLEGLLFPATYRVYNADSERQVVIRMVEQMERVGSQEEIDSGVVGRGRRRTRPTRS